MYIYIYMFQKKLRSPYPGSSLVLRRGKIPSALYYGGSNALRITVPPVGGGIRGRWTMMVDTLNDLGLQMSLRKTRAAGEVSGTRDGESYQDSWRPCPSIYHSRIIGPRGADILELAGRKIVLPPARILLWDREPAQKGWR